MLNLTDHLRRLKVDRYEYVAMKVIVLLQSGEYFKHLVLYDFKINVLKTVLLNQFLRQID